MLQAVPAVGGPPVALKVARPVKGAAAALARETVHAALALSPRLPELLDTGWVRIDGDAARVVPADTPEARPFLALRWVEGAPLDPRAPRTLAERVALALRVARGLGGT